MISCISGATHATSGRGALCGAHVVRGAYDIGLRDWERIYASWGAVQSVTFLRVDEDALEVYEVRQEPRPLGMGDLPARQRSAQRPH